MVVENTVGVRRQVTDPMLEAALRYADERHWDVLAGARLVEDGGTLRCSCGRVPCPAPGAHPVEPGWADRASGSTVEVHRMWRERPGSSVLLPTGRSFDAVDVPEAAGFLALARMERTELPAGPVLCSPKRRLVFLVLPGATARVPALLRALGRSASSLDLVVRGEGDYVPAPPTRVGTSGPVQWARPPTASNRWLPDVGELLGPLAYACGREAAAARTR
ncbi:bifunctional DNA primase/polymerase [Streptomyces thermolineatus]|uniref:bifunctional DNA primase/polymerase n=1 Tax=Streptomyces thermolineatus TaxID=44033 RepID=UPI00384C086A